MVNAINKKGQFGKLIIIVLAIIGFVVVITKFSEIINPESIKFNYVVPLPVGTVTAELDYSMLQKFVSKFKEFISKLPLTEDEIVEGSPFFLELSITSPKNQTYEGISLRIKHSPLLQNISLSDKAGKPLLKIDDDTFNFQKDLFPTDVTTIILFGEAARLDNTPYAGANIKVHVLSRGEEIFTSKDKTLKICKENVAGGCSGKVKQVSDLFTNIFTTNTSTNQT